MPVQYTREDNLEFSFRMPRLVASVYTSGLYEERDRVGSRKGMGKKGSGFWGMSNNS